MDLACPGYRRKGTQQPVRRWESQSDSTYLGDQNLRIEVPQVRNVASRTG